MDELEPAPGALIRSKDGGLVFYREVSSIDPWRITGWDSDGPRDFYVSWETVRRDTNDQWEVITWDDL